MPRIPNKVVLLICVVLIAAIAVFGWAIYRSGRVGNSGEELALEIAREAFSEDYPALLIENSHPDFQQAMPEELLMRYISGTVRQTGLLQSIERIQGNTDIPLFSIDQGTYSASYEIGLNFRDIPADLLIDMRFADERWLVTRFEVFALELGN
ncbi:MAG: hypothetical protein DHS20C12_12420 [Pseudohongiella sp.]|nr:MAG: hypothetical protein DHS20C12_12420 [Pseudohongiella sp.]